MPSASPPPRRRSIIASTRRPAAKIPLRVVAVISAMSVSLLYIFVSWRILQSSTTGSSGTVQTAIRGGGNRQPNKAVVAPRGTSSASYCPFRTYPPHRYYGLYTNQQPDFLTTSVEYIYGQWPRLLQAAAPAKLCVDQSTWRSNNNDENVWPFADGTNPSLLHVDRIRTLPAFQDFMVQVPAHVTWIATACMTNSQCSWGESSSEQYQFTTQSKPDTVRTVLLLLDDRFAVVQQTTIWLHLDVPWGKHGKHRPVADLQLIALDDARLFVHHDAVWISYREGPSFGYEAQVLNPLILTWHAKQDERGQSVHVLSAVIQASETTYFCCGRNMALLQDLQRPTQLQSLTWVDPITVISVNTTAQPVPPTKPRRKAHRQLLSETTRNHRRLGQGKNQHKSHIHGTNAFMLYIAPAKVFLGVAHFHRPNDRKTNPYARFGHHYTHAFFTITANGGDHYQLAALSPEFVFPATASQVHPHDAEIIQFSSGLEWDAVSQSIVLAYGINDCEAAVTKIPWSVVQTDWLRPVRPGTQVVDVMEPLRMDTIGSPGR